MKRIPLFGNSMNGYSSFISRQRRLNCFFEIRDDGDKQKIVVHGTPGSFVWTNLPSSPIRGFHVVANTLYVVCGLLLCSVNISGTATVLGTLNASSTGNVSMDDNSVQLLIVDGVAGYIYTIVTGSYKQAALNAAGSFGTILDANFPNGTQSACFLDGRLIVAKPNTRQFYVSEFYDGTNWTNVQSLPTFGTKDSNSDLLLAVTASNGILMLLGQQSIEFWQNVGTFPLPFGRISGATKNQGLAAQYSVTHIGDMTILLTQNLYGGDIEVSMIQGLQLQRVSTSDLEDIINNFQVHADAVSFGYILEGHRLYQITFPNAAVSFLYDATTNIWSEMQSGLALTARHFANFGITFNHFVYVSDSTSNAIYQLDDEMYTENGNPIKRQLTTRHIAMDENRFGIDELYLDLETGVGTQNGQGLNPQIMMQVSKDGGRTFGPEQWRPIGKVGQYKSPRVIWNRQGSSRDFVFQFTMTDPVKFTVIGGSVKIRQQEGAEG